MRNEPVKSDLHNRFLGTQTTICFDVHIEFIGFSQEVKRFFVSQRFLFQSVLAKGPLFLYIIFVPVARMPEFVVRVVLKGHSRARRPFSMFLGYGLWIRGNGHWSWNN